MLLKHSNTPPPAAETLAEGGPEQAAAGPEQTATGSEQTERSEQTETNGKARSPAEGPLGAFAPELDHLQRLALGVVLGTVREMIAGDAPPHMAAHLRVIIDGVTQKVGGELLPSSDWEAMAKNNAGQTDGGL
jgi:hypothetical protein